MHVDEAQAELRPQVPAVREAHRPAADDQPLGALDEQNQILLHEPAGGVERVPRVGRVAPFAYSVEHERLTGPVVRDRAVGQGEPVRPPIREMMHQRVEDLGGLFLDALNERQDGAGMPGEDVALGRHVALVGRSDLDPIGEIEGPQTEPPPERPALVGLVVGFDERHSSIVGAPIARRGPDVASVRSARYRRYVRRFPLTVVAVAPDVGCGRRGHARPGRQRTDHERRPPRRDGVAAADPEPGRRPPTSSWRGSSPSRSTPSGPPTGSPRTSSTSRSPPSPPPIPPIRPPGARCRTPAPTDRTPASASPARA